MLFDERVAYLSLIDVSSGKGFYSVFPGSYDGGLDVRHTTDEIDSTNRPYCITNQSKCWCRAPNT